MEEIPFSEKLVGCKGCNWEGKIRDFQRHDCKRAAAPAQGSAWVSVKDRLPEKRQRVLIWFRESPTEWMTRFGEITGDGHWRPEGGNGNFDDWVTHWMPLPAPPSVPQASPEPGSEFRLDQSADGLIKRIEDYRTGYSCGYADGKNGTRMRDKDAACQFFSIEGVPDVFADAAQASAPEGEKR